MQQLKKKTRDISLSSKDNKGFTIIEVMIVLVIAAVIILIVFLAVPALQRNSRNNQRRNDAARLAASTIEYRSNNRVWPDHGQLITTVGSLSLYQSTEVLVGDGATGVALYPNLANWDDSGYTPLTTIYVLTDTKCTNNNAISTTTGALAVVYGVEQSNGTRKATCV